MLKLKTITKKKCKIFEIFNFYFNIAKGPNRNFSNVESDISASCGDIKEKFWKPKGNLENLREKWNF